MTWNPQTDLAFDGQRSRPAAKLLAQIAAHHPARVVDRGPGNSTARLAARWPKARLEGLDGSTDKQKSPAFSAGLNQSVRPPSAVTPH
jgi:trans-aconitate 2-methyltransferase